MADNELRAAKRVPREMLVVGVNVLRPGPHARDGRCSEVVQALLVTFSGSFRSQDELLSDRAGRLTFKSVDEPRPRIVVGTASSPR